MMKQYLEIKARYKDALLFFRLGDFYEMFYEDALTGSRELDITLTARDSGGGARAPMCGVPFHAADNYIAKLLEKGYRVAVCEQGEVTDGAKLVERDVVRVVTRGTADSEMLNDKRSNYIMCVYGCDDGIGAAYSDITTGDFDVGEFRGADAAARLDDCLARIRPIEIVCNAAFVPKSRALNSVALEQVPPFYAYLQGNFTRDAANERVKMQFAAFKEDSGRDSLAHIAAGVLLQYFNETQKRSLPQINVMQSEDAGRAMTLDYNTRRNLELSETIRDRKKQGSLIHLLDKTVTPMGARLFRTWIERPLCDLAAIKRRQDGVEELLSDMITRAELTSALKNVRDAERLLSRLAFDNFNPQHSLGLLSTLRSIPVLKNALSGKKSAILKEIDAALNPLTETADLIEASIDPEKNVLRAASGGFIKKGFNAALDEQKALFDGGTEIIKKLEADERTETGIKNLKIGYNDVFGYYIEVSKTQTAAVPYRYSRRQTLVNCERYVTQELKTLEEKLLTARDKALKIELELYGEICAHIKSKIKSVQDNAAAIKTLDCLLSFAAAAFEFNYVRPEITEGPVSDIKNGRHPVVETASGDGERFVPNDAYIDGENDRVLIITGPNMAGKSTYMRQIALITLMAHTGGFVPADRAVIPLTDRIFTRIGASDDLAFGRSTFMVEMTELSAILKDCTERSLVILDEIGRGTSTYDGLAIARAAVEYICRELRAKTLFSTHYHELTELEASMPGIKNYRVTVRERDDKVIFLHKIERGGADKSFGIEVASLAGLPEKLIKRAKEIMRVLEEKT